jgi:hypothetical protein
MRKLSNKHIINSRPPSAFHKIKSIVNSTFSTPKLRAISLQFWRYRHFLTFSASIIHEAVKHILNTYRDLESAFIQIKCDRLSIPSSERPPVRDNPRARSPFQFDKKNFD